MCTVVVNHTPGAGARVLAVRDELMSRAFDEPGQWWPDRPGVVGGRDRKVGGSWCVSAVATGATAVVLNRPEKQRGTPSRGVLPLAAVQHGTAWPDHVDVRDMATFTVLLVASAGVTGWEWDGERLLRRDLPPGLHVATPRGIDPGDPRALRLTPLVSTRPWRAVLDGVAPSDDEAAFVVRHETEHGTYGTVFAQVIDAEPGRLRVESTRTPWDAGTWRTQQWSV